MFSVVLCCNGQAGASSQDASAKRESRGKQIYVKGTSPSGTEILAYVGESSLEVAGSMMPCANCHGLDGKGKAEGSINPSNLTWEALTKPYGVTHADGRKHPPYTERGLELAITRGTDPGGNRLPSVMPRYTMSREDLADLIFYLGRLGKDRDPGIGEDNIVIGTAIPARGALAEMGQAVKAVLNAFFDDLNSRGGVYGRRFELKVVETGETPAGTRSNIERLITEDQVFAMTAAMIAGSEKEILPLMAQKEVPLIGPLTLYPQTGFPLNRQVFYLLSGIEGQARALIEFVARNPELKKSGVAVTYSRSEINAGALEAINDQSRKDGLGAPQAHEYAGGSFDAAATAKQLKQYGRDAVFFLGSTGEALAFMRESEKLGWYPSIFLASAGGAEILDAPISFNRKIYLSFPTSPADQTAEGRNEFRAFAEKYKLPAHHVATQISVYSSGKIVVEALRRAGKDVSREKLIQALEGLYEYSTGLTPPITYGTNRRIGAIGAYVVTIDLEQKKFLPASEWIGIN